MAELPDWNDLGFRFHAADRIYRCLGDTGSEPVWGKGEYLPFGKIEISPAAAVLSYGCGVFEGLKAERGCDGLLRLFRPGDNASRFSSSAKRLAMPTFPDERFVEAVAGLVARNVRFVPPAGKGTLYVRPMMHGVEPMLGLTCVKRFAVTMYCSPVGEYFSGRDGIRLKILPFARAARGGTGGAKAMGNYAGAILLRDEARTQGFDDVLFLDAEGKGQISETSGSNFFCLLDSGELVSPPLDDTILAGITRDSTIRIAGEIDGIRVCERPISIDELFEHGREAFCTGTGWMIQSISQLQAPSGSKDFGSPKVALRIRDTLRGIRSGAVPDRFGWMLEVDTGGVSAKEDS